MPKRQRGGYPGSPRSDSSSSSSGSSRHSSTQRQGASTSSSDEVVQRLCGIFSDMRVEVARHLLEACNWDLERAIQLHLESPEIAASAQGSLPSEIPEHANRFNSLVINDDSDDDSEIPFVRQRRMSPPPKPPTAQPLMDPNEVRAPIAPQQMRLVDDMMDHGLVRPQPGQFRPLHYARAIGAASSSNNTGNGSSSFRSLVGNALQGRPFQPDDLPGPSGSTFDKYRFMSSDTLPLVDRTTVTNDSTGNNGSSNRVGPTSGAASTSTEASRSRSHQQPPAILSNGAPVPPSVSEDSSTTSLERIFKPPVDLLFRGSFQEARRFASFSNRWLLVNIQELNEFPSLCLNRDVWRDKRFVEMIQNNFVLWQVYCDGPEGARFVQFYKVSHYPFVGLVDPRTGERIAILPTTANELYQKLTEFLAERPVPDVSPNNSPMKKPKVGATNEVESKKTLPPVSSTGPIPLPTTNGHATAVVSATAAAAPSKQTTSSVPSADKTQANGSSKPEISRPPKQTDVSVGPPGSAAYFQVLVHLPNDDRLLVKLYDAATLQELISAIASNFAMTTSEYTLIRNAVNPGGAKLDLLMVPQPSAVSLRENLGFCKREKLFLDIKQ